MLTVGGVTAAWGPREGLSQPRRATPLLSQRRRDVPDTYQHVNRTVRGTQPKRTKEHSHYRGKAPLGSPL